MLANATTGQSCIKCFWKAWHWPWHKTQVQSISWNLVYPHTTPPTHTIVHFKGTFSICCIVWPQYLENATKIGQSKPYSLVQGQTLVQMTSWFTCRSPQSESSGGVLSRSPQSESSVEVLSRSPQSSGVKIIKGIVSTQTDTQIKRYSRD